MVQVKFKEMETIKTLNNNVTTKEYFDELKSLSNEYVIEVLQLLRN